MQFGILLCAATKWSASANSGSSTTDTWDFNWGRSWGAGKMLGTWPLTTHLMSHDQVVYLTTGWLLFNVFQVYECYIIYYHIIHDIPILWYPTSFPTVSQNVSCKARAEATQSLAAGRPAIAQFRDDGRVAQPVAEDPTRGAERLWRFLLGGLHIVAFRLHKTQYISIDYCYS